MHDPLYRTETGRMTAIFQQNPNGSGVNYVGWQRVPDIDNSVEEDV